MSREQPYTVTRVKEDGIIYVQRVWTDGQEIQGGEALSN